MKTVVVNKYTDEFDILITRESKWGNPFIIGKDGTREEVIEKYEVYLRENIELLLCLEELRGKRLGCVCEPLPCHGRILVKLLNEKEI